MFHDACVSEIVRHIVRGNGDSEVPKREGWYKELLDAITAIQAQLVGRFRGGPLFEDLLAALLKLSESEYGFIGETLIDENGKPFLRTCAITNIAWNDETQRFYEENVRKGLEFRNLETLFGGGS